MKKITVVLGENFFDVNAATLDFAKGTNLFCKNVVFVPSGAKESVKCAMLEKFGVVFNTEIVCPEDFLANLFDLKPLGKLKKKLYVQKAIMAVQNSLVVLGSKDIFGLAGAVLEEFERFQRAGLLPKNLQPTNLQNQFLANKLADLKLIYEKYLELTAETAQLFNFETLFAKFLEKEQDFANTNFFFVGFEVLSWLETCVVELTAKFGQNVWVGAVQANQAGNGYIFNADFLTTLESLKHKNVEISYFLAPKTLNQNQAKIAKLAFSVEEQKTNLDFLHIVEGVNPESEVRFSASAIKQLVFGKKCQAKDITILLGNMETYVPQIEKIFDEFEIPYYINFASSIKNHPLAKFALAVLNYLCHKTAENFVALTNCEFCGLSANAQTALNVFFAENGAKDFFANPAEICALEQFVADEVLKLNQKLEKLSGPLGKNQYISLFEVFDAMCKAQKYGKNLASLGHENARAQTEFVIKKLLAFGQDVLTDFEDFAGLDVLLCLEEFLEQTKFPKLTKTTNAVFVDSAENCAIQRKVLFVLGANQGVLPSVNSDTQILTDKNLQELGQNAVLSVRAQNRQKRLRIFSNLLCFEDDLFISYAMLDMSTQKLLPSGFVLTFQNCAENNIFSTMTQTIFPALANMSLQEKANFFMRKTGTRSEAQKAYYGFLNTNDVQFQDLFPTLKKTLCLAPKFEDNTRSANPLELFFADKKTKVSQIEAYFACPFKHFMAYGLKLFEANSHKVRPQDVGTLLHKVAEEFLRRLGQIGDVQEVSAQVDKIFVGLETKKGFEKYFFSQNVFSLQILKAESVRLCTYLFETQQKSNFRPKFLEVYFGKEQKYTLRVLGQDFSLVGVVDRVDVCNGNAVVIDYKTSQSIKGSSEELFYGEKIQIFVYARAIEKLYNLKPMGVFYLPISNKFIEDAGKMYMMKGKNVFDEQFLKNFDTSLNYDNPKSTMFPCEIKTSKEVRQQGIVEYSQKSSHVQQSQFEDMLSYATTLVCQGIKEILGGQISVLPKEGACALCPYLAICQKNQTTKQRVKCYEINDSNFALWKNEGENSGQN